MKSVLQNRFNELKKIVSHSGPSYIGLQFERLMLEILEQEDLAPKLAYSQNNQQINGLFEFEYRFYLLEAKWVNKKIPASEIYAFSTKLERKLTGTHGVFIAINGYAEDVPTLFPYGKQTNLILFDGEDMHFALMDSCSFGQVLKVKLRWAVQQGEVFYPYKRHVEC